MSESPAVRIEAPGGGGDARRMDPITAQLFNSPPSFVAHSGADAAVRQDVYTNFQTGEFRVGSPSNSIGAPLIIAAALIIGAILLRK